MICSCMRYCVRKSAVASGWVFTTRSNSVYFNPPSSAFFDFTVGSLIQPDALDGDSIEVTRALERHTVVDLAHDADAWFRNPVSCVEAIG